MSLMSRIGKAARLLDLKGDVGRATDILRGVLSNPAIEQHLPEKVEVLVFLAEYYFHIEEKQQAAEYLGQLASLDLAGVEPDLVDPHLRRARVLRAALAGGGA